MFPLSLFAIVSGEDSVLVCVLSQKGGLLCFPCHCLPLFLERIVSLFVSFHNKVGCHVLLDPCHGHYCYCSCRE